MSIVQLTPILEKTFNLDTKGDASTSLYGMAVESGEKALWVVDNRQDSKPWVYKIDVSTPDNTTSWTATAAPLTDVPTTVTYACSAIALQEEASVVKRVWVNNDQDSNLYYFDPAVNKVSSLDLSSAGGGGANDIKIDNSQKKLWIADHQNGKLLSVDTSTVAVTSPADIPAISRLTTPANKRIWYGTSNLASPQTPGSLGYCDYASTPTVKSILTTDEPVKAVASRSDGKTVWAITAGSQIVRIDKADTGAPEPGIVATLETARRDVADILVDANDHIWIAYSGDTALKGRLVECLPNGLVLGEYDIPSALDKGAPQALAYLKSVDQILVADSAVSSRKGSIWTLRSAGWNPVSGDKWTLTCDPSSLYAENGKPFAKITLTVKNGGNAVDKAHILLRLVETGDLATIGGSKAPEIITSTTGTYDITDLVAGAATGDFYILASAQNHIPEQQIFHGTVGPAITGLTGNDPMETAHPGQKFASAVKLIVAPPASGIPVNLNGAAGPGVLHFNSTTGPNSTSPSTDPNGTVTAELYAGATAGEADITATAGGKTLILKRKITPWPDSLTVSAPTLDLAKKGSLLMRKITVTVKAGTDVVADELVTFHLSADSNAIFFADKDKNPFKDSDKNPVALKSMVRLSTDSNGTVVLGDTALVAGTTYVYVVGDAPVTSSLIVSINDGEAQYVQKTITLNRSA
ncbi:hypothetical protein [Paraburkholderia caffeinilytica]|uniref:hypothetical protein n=1 Tax=Paraburkholderia caffeinilytica TaxID=1761016 RepID=UPI003DA1C41E